MCDYSLHNVKSRPAKVGDKLVPAAFRLPQEAFVRRKISTSQFACFRARSCRSLTKSSAHVCGRGAEISSPTRLLFSAKSIKTARMSTTTP